MTHHPAQTRRKHRRGFALLAVMWLSVAIASVTLAFALEARQNRIAATSLSESTQALAAARAGIETTLSRLAYLHTHARLPSGITRSVSIPILKDDPWQWADSLLRDRVDLGGPGYEIYVRKSGTILNINSASETQWHNFLRGMRFDATLVGRLSQSIMDWHDDDDAVRANGAERNDYISAGRILLPTNRDFRTVDELRNVMDMNTFVYDSIAPYLTTTHSFTGYGPLTVDINTAPAPILRSIPNMTDDVVAVILNRRATGHHFASFDELLTYLPSSTANQMRADSSSLGLFEFVTSSVEITSIGWAPGGHTRVVSTVLVQRFAIPVIVWTNDE